MEHENRFKILNAAQLKILAMALMLCDHLWATLFPYHQWLTNIGRIAFPIFAFQLVEGYFCTRNFRAYLKRMFLFALISEIPFNLMTAGGLINPFQQNVMFTFCLGLLLIRFLDSRKGKKPAAYFLTAAFTCLMGYFLGTITFVDYYGYGILMILAFYLFRNLPHGWLGILLSMILINQGLMEGLSYPVTLFGMTFYLEQQSFAILALIPIFMYNGKRGYHSKAFQYFSYAFYPAHMLILSLIWLAVA